MNAFTKKLLDVLLFVGIFFIIFSFFQKEPVAPVGGGIELTALEKKYSIPADIFLELKNTSSESVALNTCDNIQVRFLGGELEKFLECSDMTIQAGETETFDFSPYYKKFLREGDYTFDLQLNQGEEEKRYSVQVEVNNKGFFGKLFTEIFYAPVFNLTIFFVELFSHSLGWAIVAVTILVRILLLWPQHKMMVSQRKMQKIQPKVKALQEKHKGNQQAVGMALMELYKKEGVNPMGSCGFLIIQMPILLVIYHIILSIKSETNFYYLYSFLGDAKLENISFDFFGIDLLSSGGLTGLIAALLVGGIQWIQVKLSLMKNAATQKTGVVLEKKKGESGYSSMMPDPAMMNKFMLWGMPAMIAVFTYTFFIGIGLYWGISTLFAIFQQLVVNKKVKK